MTERSPGTWRLRVYVGDDPLTGNPRQVHRTFRGTENEAAKALAGLVTESEGDKVDRSKATVGQLLDRWLVHLERTGRKPTTIRVAKYKIERRIRPALGLVPLSKLSPDTLDRCYEAWEADGLATATVRSYHALLSSALHQGVRWHWIAKNPAVEATPSSSDGESFKPPTLEEVNRLVAAAEESDPVLATTVALAALTGARRGELVALRWSDIDLDTAHLTISRSISVVDGVTYEGPTKSHQVRHLALDELCIAVLDRRRAFQEKLSEDAASPMVEDPYVLSYQAYSGTPVSGDTISHRFAAVAAKLGISCRFHDLRHFSVTTLIAAGVDVRTVSTRHGHATATMTLNRYAHALPASDREAANLADRCCSRPQKARSVLRQGERLARGADDL
jgi:integrase